MDTLKLVARAIVAILGHRSEVVIHDLSRPEASIVWIEGNVTGREIGAPATDLLLRESEKDARKEILNYQSYSNGKVLKCSSVIFGDAHDSRVALCINLDITDLVAAEHVLQSLVKHSDEEVEESFPKDFMEISETLIAKAAYEIKTPTRFMNKAERMHLIDKLEQQGVFQMKKAVPVVADRLGVSRATVYNYLSEVWAARRNRQSQSSQHDPLRKNGNPSDSH